MATIADVAAAAGVSRSTVSHALSGKRPISAQTRQRIFAAVDELHYTANARARALATRKSSIMALSVPFAHGEFAPVILQYVLAITEEARSIGYDILMVTEKDEGAGIGRVTESDLVDGVLLMGVRRADDRIGVLRNARQPGVLIGYADDEPGIDMVDLDFAAAAAGLVRHLYDQGHREIILVTSPDEVFDAGFGYAWRFRDSALRTAADCGMGVRVVACKVNPSDCIETLGEAIDTRGRATALLVHCDEALIDLPQVLGARSLRVPDDLAVVSLLPDEFGQMFFLPYTTVDSSVAQVAAEAVGMLANRIENPNAPFVRHLLQPVITDRGTSRLP